MNDDLLVRVEGVSKKFCRSLKKSLWYGMQDLGNELRGRRHGGDGELRPDEFWAVKDVGFELKRGECLGLIGRNGAGKTTLLRMLSGLIKPDQGRIEMRGRVGALIALGAGFNPVLTGRENIFVNGSILGLTSKEINERFEDIVDFAGIGRFIDTPVQSYSSGMQVRLGFAVASTLDPDVLVIDEILAVGDLSFRLKCMTRIGELMDRAAVIFVSHHMELIDHLCHKVALLGEGNLVYCGATSEGIDRYAEDQESEQLEKIHCVDWITDIAFTQNSELVHYRDGLDLCLVFNAGERSEDCMLRVCFIDRSNRTIAEWRSIDHGIPINIGLGMNKIDVSIQTLPLAKGRYTLNVNLQPNNSSQYFVSGTALGAIDVIGSKRCENSVIL